MGKNYSVYIKDDDLVKIIDELSEEAFDGTSETFRHLVRFGLDDKEDMIRELYMGEKDPKSGDFV